MHLNKAYRSAQILVLTLLLLLASNASAIRPHEWAAPLSGNGTSILPADEAIPNQGQASAEAFQFKQDALLKDFLRELNQDKTKSTDTIGGDDVIVDDNKNFHGSDIDIASNGDIYIAVQVVDDTSGYGIEIYRSQDGGNIFSLWGTQSNATYSESYAEPSLEICEGAEELLYIAYRRYTGGQSSIRVSYSGLDGATAMWSSEMIALAAGSDNFHYPDLCTDNESFADFYLYLVAQGQDGSGQDIWYTRSTDQGDTWDAGYEIGSLSLSDRGYSRPDVAYGYGGHIHVAWEFSIYDDDYDDAIRYRKCPNFGSGGLSNWGPLLGPTTHINGILEKEPQVAASWASSDVVIACRRYSRSGDGYLYNETPGILASDDYGDTFGALSFIDDGPTFITEMHLQPGSNSLALVGFKLNDRCIQWSNITNPTVWGDVEIFTDDPLWLGTIWNMGVAFDPTHADRAATAWGGGTGSGDPGDLFFDAEWHADPGYPNLEDGFPVDLANSPLSDPAVVDLDGDGFLEIVFANSNKQICAYNHDGSTVPGWPVEVGEYLSSGPVAIGDLFGLGEMCVVAGTVNGHVVSYDPSGNLMPGFPSTMPQSKPAYVSIGNLGGFYKGTIVVTCGTSLRFFNYKGEIVAMSFGYDFATTEFEHAAAIGDYNNDGITEVVFSAGSYVSAKRMLEYGTMFTSSYAPHEISGALTMGDLNLDGDLEIAVPLSNGSLYMINRDGPALPGFPYVTATGTALSSVSWANMWSTHEPELAFAAKNYTVEVLGHSGAPIPGFPVNPGPGWYLYGSPIVGLTWGEFSPDIIIGSRDQNLWSYNNYGVLNPGWPKPAGDVVHRTPALGDLDADGRAEVVFLSQSQLIVVDVNNAVQTSEFSWHMAGNNPERTGCYNCPSGSTTPVEPNDPTSPLITRVSFAAPAPNPTSGPTLFSFDLPVRSAVQLEVYDVRGHRVQTVLKEEVAVGSHTISWNGRGHNGRMLASGVYFARLQVRGPGLNQVLTRKVNMLR